MDQKSLTIHSRDKYGPEVMEYQFFPGNSTDKYRSIILRNSGNDWVSTMFRDALAQGLFSGQVDLDTQAYRPAVVYINGQYVGYPEHQGKNGTSTILKTISAWIPTR